MTRGLSNAFHRNIVLSNPKKRNALSLATLKSLRSDILHEAESKDLKVIIIAGISLTPVVSGPRCPPEVAQNVLVSWDSLSLHWRVALTPFEEVKTFMMLWAWSSLALGTVAKAFAQ